MPADQTPNPFESPQTVSSADSVEPTAAAPDPLPELDDLVTVASFSYIGEANLAVTLLEHEGIDCCLDNEGIVSVHAFLSNAVGGVKVMVRRRDSEHAAQFLHEHRKELVAKQSTEDIEFDCEECGAPLTFPGKRRGCVETCPKCREFIDVPD